MRQEPFLREFGPNKRRAAGFEAMGAALLRNLTPWLNRGRGCRGSLLRRQLAVQLHDFQSHFSGGVHVFDVEPFLDRVDGPHSRAEIGALDSFAIEDVRITAAA